jgi:hypothetical protein
VIPTVTQSFDIGIAVLRNDGGHAVRVFDRHAQARERRSLAVLAIFTSAILVAFVLPRIAFGLVCAALILHVRPEAPSFTNR